VIPGDEISAGGVAVAQGAVAETLRNLSAMSGVSSAQNRRWPDLGADRWAGVQCSALRNRLGSATPDH
jgi:hypothetical protein